MPKQLIFHAPLSVNELQHATMLDEATPSLEETATHCLHSLWFNKDGKLFQHDRAGPFFYTANDVELPSLSQYLEEEIGSVLKDTLKYDVVMLSYLGHDIESLIMTVDELYHDVN